VGLEVLGFSGVRVLFLVGLDGFFCGLLLVVHFGF
jgi:hypothetical protein